MQKTIFGLLSVFLIIAPYLNNPDFLHYDNKRIFQLVIFGLIGLSILVKLFKKDRNFTSILPVKIIRTSKPLLIAFSVLICAGLVSVFFSHNKEFAILEYVFFFLLISLLFIITPSSRKTHWYLGKFIIASALVYSGIYLVLFVGNYISSFFDPMIILWPKKYDFTLLINGVELHGKETLYFDNERFFNHTQTWTIPILIGFYSYYRQKFSDQWVISALLFLMISLWWVLIFASAGRGTVLSLVLSAIFLSFIWRRDLLNFLKNGALTLTVGALLHFLLFQLIPGSSDTTPLFRSTDSGRLDLWQSAFNSWLQNPIFGIGPMQYAQLGSEPIPAHPHNFYIQFLTEWGFIGFVALALIVIFLFKYILNNYPSRREKFQSKFLYISASWSLLAAFIHAFFSGIFHTPMSQIWFVLIVAWFLGFSMKNASVSYSHTIKKYASLTYVVAVLIVAFLVYDDIAIITQGYIEYESSFPNSKIYPRFWGQGLFE